MRSGAEEERGWKKEEKNLQEEAYRLERNTHGNFTNHMEIMSNLRLFYPNVTSHCLFRNYYFCALDYLFVSDSSILRMEEKISYNFIEVYVL